MKDNRFIRDKWVVKAKMGRLTTTDHIYAARIKRHDSSFLMYWDVVKKIFMLNYGHKFNEIEFMMLWWIHARPTFTQSEFFNYPNSYRTGRSRNFLFRLRDDGWIAVAKEHGRGCPRIWHRTKEMDAVMSKYYSYLIGSKPIPKKKDLLGKYLQDVDFMEVIRQQNETVKYWGENVIYQAYKF